MERQIERLVNKTWDKLQEQPESHRLIIGISGIPGAGKTTIAAWITERINERYFATEKAKITSPIGTTAKADVPVAAFVPMDGYHFSRAQLSAMPNPEEAHARRGAAFTFDGDAFLALVRQVREPLDVVPTMAAEAVAATAREGGETGTAGVASCSSSSPPPSSQPLKRPTRVLYAPSFDHAVKDPVADDIAIAPTTRVLIFEGNYLGLDRPPWRDAARLMDELWFVEVGFDVAKARLVKRHVQAGIAANEEEARKRVEENDLVNGREIVDERLPMDEIIISQ